MIQVRKHILLTNAFVDAFKKLSTKPLPFKTGKKVWRLSKALEPEVKRAREEFLTLQDKLLIMEENKPKIENGDFVFKEGVNREHAKIEIETFGLSLVTIREKNLDSKDFESLEFDQMEIDCLSPFFEDSE